MRIFGASAVGAAGEAAGGALPNGFLLLPHAHCNMFNARLCDL